MEALNSPLSPQHLTSSDEAVTVTRHLQRRRLHFPIPLTQEDKAKIGIMHFDDLFDFDEGVYAAKARTLSNDELKRRETEKARQMLSGFAAVGGGIGAAAATGGMSLVFTGIGGRKVDVAKKKLEIVQAELQRRRVPLKDGFTKADIAIPAVGALVGMGVGNGVEGMLGAGDGAISATGAAAGVAFGDVVAGNVAGDVGGGRVEWALQQFQTREKHIAWTTALQSTKGCGNLGGQSLDTDRGGIDCDRCGTQISRGLYGREFTSTPDAALRFRC